MSNKFIRKALEKRLAALPNVPTIVFENTNFVPVNNVAYIATNMMFSEPDDLGFMDSPYNQLGYMQVTLFYPTNKGPGAAETLAEGIRIWFARGSSFTTDGISVIIEKTPEVSGGSIEENAYVVRVYVRFRAMFSSLVSNITSGDYNSLQEW